MRALRGSNAQAVLAALNPDHPGMGGLLPGRGVARGVHRAGRLHVEAHLQVGHATATRTSRRAGSSTATSAGSTSSGTTAGCSATATAAPTCPSSPGPTSSGTTWSRDGVPGRPRPGRLLGRSAPQTSNPRWTTTPCACSPGRTGRCPLCGDHLLTPISHRSPHEWEHWLTATRKAIAKHYLVAHGWTGTPDEITRLVHASCHRRTRPRTQGPSTAHLNCPMRLA